MDRRAFLSGVSAVAVAAVLPRAPATSQRIYHLPITDFLPVKGGLPVTAVYETPIHISAVLFPGRISTIETFPQVMLPEFMLDWRKATPAEIIGDIEHALSSTDQSPAVRAYVLSDLPEHGPGEEPTGPLALNRGLK